MNPGPVESIGSVDSTESDGHRVVVDVPASPRSLRILRLAAADAAADMSFDVDTVESARIAVDELASVLISSGSWSRMAITLWRREGCLWVEGRITEPPADAGPIRIDDVVDQLLRTCVQEYRLTDDGDGLSFTFVVAPRGDPSPLAT